MPAYIENRLKDLIDSARTSIDAHVDALSTRLTTLEEQWRRSLSDERQAREEALEAMRCRIEQNQTLLLETASEDKGLMDAVHRDLDSLNSRHALVLEELAKSKADSSYAAGAHSTLQDFVGQVLVRFEALREQTEVALAGIVERTANTGEIRNVEEERHRSLVTSLAELRMELAAQQDAQQQALRDVREDLSVQRPKATSQRGELWSQVESEQIQLATLRQDLQNVRAGLANSVNGLAASGCNAEHTQKKSEDQDFDCSALQVSEGDPSSLAGVKDAVDGLCGQVRQLQENWEQAFAELKSSLHQECEKRGREANQLTTGLAERLSAATADASQRIDEQAERLDDISRCLGRMVSKKSFEDASPAQPRIRAELVEAALSTEGAHLDATKKRLELMREALSPNVGKHKISGSSGDRLTPTTPCPSPISEKNKC